MSDQNTIEGVILALRVQRLEDALRGCAVALLRAETLLARSGAYRQGPSAYGCVIGALDTATRTLGLRDSDLSATGEWVRGELRLFQPIQGEGGSGA